MNFLEQRRRSVTSIMGARVLGVVVAGLLVLGVPAKKVFGGTNPSVEEILQSADRARGSSAVASGVSWEVQVDSDDGTTANSVTYDLKVKGSDALAEAIAPARNKGETLLFNDRNIWFFKIGIKKPVAISPRQKLMGQAANGDIASTNYARDYSGQIVGSELIDGEDTWKLELKAKEKNVTYDRIRYWVRKKDRLGVKAEFLTIGGEVFKKASFKYNNSLDIGGKKMPFVSLMSIVDAINSASKTTLKYQPPKAQKHPDSIFNVNNLIR
jgi:Outer membrane lipoprotein-sorting protein